MMSKWGKYNGSGVIIKENNIPFVSPTPTMT